MLGRPASRQPLTHGLWSAVAVESVEVAVLIVELRLSGRGSILAEILNPEQMLVVLGEFGPLRRILLATSGTLQSTLAAYFRSPVTVEVKEQIQSQDQTRIHRKVELWCHSLDLMVCRASSALEVEAGEMLDLIQSRKVGLGQTIEMLHLPTHFELKGGGVGDGFFWRDYTLKGPGFHYQIHEEFPENLYPER
jgi:hypothetical protein